MARLKSNGAIQRRVFVSRGSTIGIVSSQVGCRVHDGGCRNQLLDAAEAAGDERSEISACAAGRRMDGTPAHKTSIRLKPG
jgi:hypothetical protein